MDALALKKEFAAHLYREPGNPFAAACKVFPDDIGSACKYAVEWIKDDEVKDEIDRLEIEGDLSDQVKDKVAAANLAWEMATNAFFKSADRVNALRLFAEIAGHMPEKTINKNIKSENPVNRVMLVKDFGESEQWEKDLLNQQTRLVNG